MSQIILDRIPFRVDVEALVKKLRIEDVDLQIEDLTELVSQAEALASPKAMYRIAFIDSKGEDFIVVDGVKLTSRVLRVNLDKAHRVFVYVATCGRELEEWASSIGDPLHRYWADEIKELALGSAMQALNEHMDQHVQPGRTSHMSPGSLKDWPIDEQRAIFALLGDTQEKVGVVLTDSLLMIPTKSVSGIAFATEEDFESCELCPRDDCRLRRKPYDPQLYNRKYATEVDKP